MYDYSGNLNDNEDQEESKDLWGLDNQEYEDDVSQYIREANELVKSEQIE